MASPSHAASPTRARFIVLAFLCALMFVLYLDRLCIGQAEKPIRDELGLGKVQMSFVQMAFTLAYGLFELPVGHWGDRIGSRAVLTRIAVCWSVFTAATSLCTGFVSLLLVRFLFGVGESGALPNSARVVSRWFPAREKGRVQGLIQASMLIGGTAAPVVAAYIIREMDWRWAFVLFGLTGLVWAAAFWVWFRDDPARHPAVNDAELRTIGLAGDSGDTYRAPIPWRAVLRNRSIWTLGMIMTCSSFNSYFYFSWFPTYLREGRGVEQVDAGWLASLVLGGGAAGTLVGGVVSDEVARRGIERVRGRRWHGTLGYSLAAGSLAVGVLCEDAGLSAAFASLSCFCAASTLSNWWGSASEVGGKHIGALFGLMNGMGVVGAMSSQFFFGAFPEWREEEGYTGRDQWDPAFAVVASLLVVAAFLWSRYTSRPVAPAEQQGHEASHT